MRLAQSAWVSVSLLYPLALASFQLSLYRVERDGSRTLVAFPRAPASNVARAEAEAPHPHVHRSNAAHARAHAPESVSASAAPLSTAFAPDMRLELLVHLAPGHFELVLEDEMSFAVQAAARRFAEHELAAHQRRMRARQQERAEHRARVLKQLEILVRAAAAASQDAQGQQHQDARDSLEDALRLDEEENAELLHAEAVRERELAALAARARHGPLCVPFAFYLHTAPVDAHAHTQGQGQGQAALGAVPSAGVLPALERRFPPANGLRALAGDAFLHPAASAAAQGHAHAHAHAGHAHQEALPGACSFLACGCRNKNVFQAEGGGESTLLPHPAGELEEGACIPAGLCVDLGGGGGGGGGADAGAAEHVCQCVAGFEGARCERCASGFTGFPNCQPEDHYEAEDAEDTEEQQGQEQNAEHGHAHAHAGEKKTKKRKKRGKKRRPAAAAAAAGWPSALVSRAESAHAEAEAQAHAARELRREVEAAKRANEAYVSELAKRRQLEVEHVRRHGRRVRFPLCWIFFSFFEDIVFLIFSPFPAPRFEMWLGLHVCWTVSVSRPLRFLPLARHARWRSASACRRSSGTTSGTTWSAGADARRRPPRAGASARPPRARRRPKRPRPSARVRARVRARARGRTKESLPQTSALLPPASQQSP